MESFEKNISALIPQMFPEIYRDTGPVFIEFVKQYYKWMESEGKPLFYTRRMDDIEDIDETFPEFLNHFRYKYLQNIQLDTVKSTRELVKHSLDLYRSKGTERSLQLLFRAAFGVAARIYRPGDDLLKTSDGKWFRPQYLEVSLDARNAQFSSRQINGITSKASAFVETVVRRKTQNKISDLLYISNVRGRFQAGELLQSAGIDYQPNFLGSLTNITVDTFGTGDGFAIGDIVDVSSNSGYEALGRIANIAFQSGLVNFSLDDGGYGFNSNSAILLSTKNITIQNVNTTPIILETISQPLANLHYLNANGIISAGQTINAYYANNTLQGSAIVLSINQQSASNGYMLVEVLSGNVSANAIYVTGNTIGANLSVIDGFQDLKATGTVVGFQFNANNIKVGVSNVINQFVTNAQIQTSNSGITGNVFAISKGSGAGFGISNNLLYPEYVSINTDSLAPYANLRLNANTYGFPGNVSANASTPMINYLSFSNTLFGKIQTLVNVNPGDGNYNDPPFLTIVDRISSKTPRYNYILGISNTNSSFLPGEIITQTSTNGRALVIAANNSVVIAENLRVNPSNWLQNDGTTIVGSDSVANAVIISVDSDMTSNAMGLNAVVEAIIHSGNGSASVVEVIDSGFGFEDQETVVINKGNVIGTGIANVTTYGTGSGYYKRLGGRLSSEKRIYDGYYYQEFSYEVISSVQLDKYSDLLKKVVHTAGYIFFGTVEHTAKLNQTITVNTIITST